MTNDNGTGQELERIVSVVRLPDGGFGAQNERPVNDLTEDDIQGIAAAMHVWLTVRHDLIEKEEQHPETYGGAIGPA